MSDLSMNSNTPDIVRNSVKLFVNNANGYVRTLTKQKTLRRHPNNVGWSSGKQDNDQNERPSNEAMAQWNPNRKAIRHIYDNDMNAHRLPERTERARKGSGETNSS